MQSSVKRSRLASIRGYHLSVDQAISDVAKPEDAESHNNISYEDRKTQCVKTGTLFEDPDFPATDESLYVSKKAPRKYVWKRPGEISPDASLFVSGASRFDIIQGNLGDCWFMASLSALTQYKGLLNQVIPPGQSLTKDYTGLFRFRFWQYGRWEEVVIDDRLPTYNNQLVFLHSSENQEFWSALIEKAYAKVYGSYEALNGGTSSEAMEDFTGGIAETFMLNELPDDFFKLMQKAVERQSLMCCSTAKEKDGVQRKLDNGLLTGHAYTVTAVKKLTLHTGGEDAEIELVRIRNPWGGDREWNGPWSDESDEWKAICVTEKNEIGLAYDDDGEFWMSYVDFIKHFMKIEMCMLNPDSAGDIKRKGWEMKINQGTWQKYVSAGGCRNFDKTFHLNPQYRITLEDPDDDNDVVDNCSIVIGLLQRGRNKVKKPRESRFLSIGFAIYQLTDDAWKDIENDRLGKKFFTYHKQIAKSKNYLNTREVVGRFSLPPGEYVIMPTTYKNNEEGAFILRMFSEKAHCTECMDTATKYESAKKAPSPVVENNSLDERLHSLFKSTAGEDGEVDSFELQILATSIFKDAMHGNSFHLEACRSMVAMIDYDRSGRLNYKEFRDLWKRILDWKRNFKRYDIDNSGDMDASELRDALSDLGYKLSTSALSSIVLRYANRKGGVSVDDFIQICCRLKSAFTSYGAYRVPETFSIDEYIMSTLYT